MTEIGNLDFPRDRWGRPLITVPGESKPVPYTRISSFGTVLENQFGLNKWKMRTMLRGALDRPDLRARAESKLDDDRFLDEIVEQMIEHGGGSRAANMGTAIHEVLSQVNKGASIGDIPTDFRPHAQAWQDALDAHGFTVAPRLVESHLVNDEFRAAGSGDVFLMREGTLYACDIKTGKSISPRPLAYMVQLYLYASAQGYNVVSGERESLGAVSLDTAYIAHIPASDPTCIFYEVDLREARRLTVLAAAVKDADKGDKVRATGRVRVPEATVERPPSPSPIGGGAPVAERMDWLRDRLRIIIDTDNAIVPRVRGGWPDGVPTLKEGGLTNAQCDDLARFFDLIESDIGIPFGAPDPAALTTGVRKSRDADERAVRDAFPGAILVDDDSEPDPALIAEIKAMHDALAPEQRAWVDSISKQATAAKRAISLKVKRTTGRAERVRTVLACVDLAEDADVIGTLLRTVTGHNQPISDFGAVFGALTIEQAQRLRRIVHNLGNATARLVFDGDTVTAVEGDIA